MANPSIQEYLEIRENEIKELRTQLLVELREISVAKAAIVRSRYPDGNIDESPSRTIKEMITDVLSVHRQGGSADQIIAWIRETHRTEVVRSSLSPQLSRLKAEGIIVLDDQTSLWRSKTPEEMHQIGDILLGEGNRTKSIDRMVKRMTGHERSVLPVAKRR